MKQQNIGLKLGVVFSFLIALLVGLAWLGLEQMSRIHSDMETLVLARWNKVQLSRQALGYLIDNYSLTGELSLAGNKLKAGSLLAAHDANTDRVTNLLRQIETASDSDTERELIAQIGKKRTEYTASYSLAVAQLIQGDQFDDSRAALIRETLPRLATYQTTWKAYVTHQITQFDRVVKASDERYHRTRTFFGSDSVGDFFGIHDGACDNARRCQGCDSSETGGGVVATSFCRSPTK